MVSITCYSQWENYSLFKLQMGKLKSKTLKSVLIFKLVTGCDEGLKNLWVFKSYAYKGHIPSKIILIKETWHFGSCLCFRYEAKVWSLFCWVHRWSQPLFLPGDKSQTLRFTLIFEMELTWSCSPSSRVSCSPSRASACARNSAHKESAGSCSWSSKSTDSASSFAEACDQNQKGDLRSHHYLVTVTSYCT